MNTYLATMDVLAVMHEDNAALYHKAVVADDVQTRWLLNSTILYKAALLARCQESRDKLIIESKRCYDLAHVGDNQDEDWDELGPRTAVECMLPDDDEDFNELLKEISECDERHG